MLKRPAIDGGFNPPLGFVVANLRRSLDKRRRWITGRLLPSPVAVHDGRSVLGSKGDVYSVLQHWPAGLMLDVGAGVGSMAAKMLQNSPRSRVIAFEPFPGNMKFIKDRLGADSRVEILQKAVSHSAGTARFKKPETVAAGVAGWEDFEGYSSIGYLVPDNATTETIDVEVTTIDQVASERVRFLKIDVQGGELDVLRGAAKTIERHGIDLMLVEYSGQSGVIEFLTERGYRLFDTHYLVVPRDGGEPNSADWSDLEQITLSTGAKSYLGWPNSIPRQKDRYAEFFGSSYRKTGYVQTDLVAVHASVEREFRARRS